MSTRAKYYIVSCMRTSIGGQPFLQVVDIEGKETWAYIPYSDRTPEEHHEAYFDAQLIADAFNSDIRLRMGN